MKEIIFIYLLATTQQLNAEERACRNSMEKLFNFIVSNEGNKNSELQNLSFENQFQKNTGLPKKIFLPATDNFEAYQLEQYKVDIINNCRNNSCTKTLFSEFLENLISLSKKLIKEAHRYNAEVETFNNNLKSLKLNNSEINNLTLELEVIDLQTINLSNKKNMLDIGGNGLSNVFNILIDLSNRYLPLIVNREDLLEEATAIIDTPGKEEQVQSIMTKVEEIDISIKPIFGILSQVDSFDKKLSTILEILENLYKLNDLVYKTEEMICSCGIKFLIF